MLGSPQSRRHLGWAGPLVAATLAVAACAPPGASEGSTPSGAGGTGVPVGSDAAAYAEALADMEPVTLEYGGHTTGPGAASVDSYVEYTDLLEEMSGGKITVEHDYGGAKVSLPEMADALGQGRTDMGSYIPAYQPDEWPVANAVGALSIYGQPHPISGRMATFAAQAEFALSFEALQEEAERHGVHALYPLYSPSHDIKLECTGDAPTSLEELQGRTVRVSSPAHVGMAEAIGMTPVSLVITELFQGLQRGVVDCAVNSISQHLTGGYAEIVDNWVFSTEQGALWAETPSSWGFSQKAWQDLPLAARQLIWDTQPRMLENLLSGTFASYVKSMEVSEAKGMELTQFEPEVTDRIQEFYAGYEKQAAADLEEMGLTDDGMAAVEQYKGLYDKWWRIVTEELGYPADTSWATLTEDFSADPESFDLQPFVDRFYQEVLLPQRPE